MTNGLGEAIDGVELEGCVCPEGRTAKIGFYGLALYYRLGMSTET